MNFRTTICRAYYCGLLAAFMLTTLDAQAQVVFDGSVGPVGSLNGQMSIGEAWGSRRGSNLFHSFSQFNINPGESVTFTAGFPTTHVIGRVTGGMKSIINGPLVNSIPGASLWLINPAGMVFGEGSSVDVQGSFYASTADYMLLEDSGKFAADLSDMGGTILTMGDPIGFGFLGPTNAALRMQETSVTLSSGSELMLVAGDIEINDSQLMIESGMISLISVATEGFLDISSGLADTTQFNGFDDITLANSTLDSSGSSGGEVYIVAGQLLLDQGTEITTRSLQSGGGIISITADDVVMDNESWLEANNEGSSTGGKVSVVANGSIQILNGSRIEAQTLGQGGSGGVELTAGEYILISGSSANGPSFVNTSSHGAGDGGDQDIQAPEVFLLQGATLLSEATNLGDGGSVSISAPLSLTLDGYSDRENPTLIYTGTSNRGNAGNITLNVGALNILNGARIATPTLSLGDAGDINIMASGDFHASGYDLTGEGGSLISASQFGDAGDVSIEAANIDISDGFAISTNSLRDGRAGHIVIRSVNLFMSNGARLVSNNAVAGASGSILIDVEDTLRITTGENSMGLGTRISSTGINGVGAGDIEISARAIEMNNGSIFAVIDNSDVGSGSITLNASGYIRMENAAVIEASSRDLSVFGPDITINTPLLEMTGFSQISTDTFQLRSKEVTDGGAGSIYINVGDLLMNDATIEANSCDCGAGSPGDIFINASGLVSISGLNIFGEAAGILTKTWGGRSGGNIYISADKLQVFNHGGIISSSPASQQDIIDSGFPTLSPGNAGEININTNQLHMSGNGIISTAAREAAGGTIKLNISDFIYLIDSTISAEALGVTDEDDGGNVLITDPTAIVLNRASIIANANAGNGGNIFIKTGVLVPSLESTISASSQTGLDGKVIIESPNQQITDVALLETPVFDISELVEDPCQVQSDNLRSSLTVEGKGGIPSAPDEYQANPGPAIGSDGSPQETQTAGIAPNPQGLAGSCKVVGS